MFWEWILADGVNVSPMTLCYTLIRQTADGVLASKMLPFLSLIYFNVCSQVLQKNSSPSVTLFGQIQ